MVPVWQALCGFQRSSAENKNSSLGSLNEFTLASGITEGELRRLTPSGSHGEGCRGKVHLEYQPAFASFMTKCTKNDALALLPVVAGPLTLQPFAIQVKWRHLWRNRAASDWW